MSPVYQEFEYTLAWHCAPSMAGIKPADLISWRIPEGEGLKVLGYYANVLSRRGIRMRVLGRNGDRLLILIFRPGRLECCLRDPRVEEMLSRAGYPVGAGTQQLLCHLRDQLSQSDFPHEIGLFLGYPPEDVEGFRADGGRCCKYSGTWKVYGDVSQARKQFDAFHRCRQALTRKLNQGKTLEQMFPAA